MITSILGSRAKAIALGAVAVLLLSLVGAAWFYKNAYEKERLAFDLFKERVKSEGQEAEHEKALKEKEWESKVKDLETEYEEAIRGTRAGFARELTRLRESREGGSTGGGALSSTKSTPNTCSDAAGNERLSIALFGYREGVLQLLEQAQIQTDTLVACQTYVRSILGAER